MFCGFGLNLSHVACEIVTAPNGDPPGGGLKMPITRNVFDAPVENVSLKVDPPWSLCFLA